jgi:hypothetical protein
VNWVADSNCSINDPNRRNFRILATTGAYRDSLGGPDFFSLIAFMVNQSIFETNFTTTEGDSTISYDANGANPRGYTMQFLVANFLAYAAVTQQITLNGKITLAPTPCGSQQDPTILPADCFNTGTLPHARCGSNSDPSVPCFAVNTFNLRQDWRITSNRNAMDGSDNNCVDPTEKAEVCEHNVNTGRGVQDSPFGYFCDDLLGTWLIHYWWYDQFAIGGFDTNGNPITPTANCTKILNCIAPSSVNGVSLDGTPIITTGGQLDFLEGVPHTPANVFPGQGVAGACLQNSDLPPATAPCAADGADDPTGGDHAAIWLICPDFADPRNGAIASDAFLDAVRLPDGSFQDQSLAQNFICLQQQGKFCGE